MTKMTEPFSEAELAEMFPADDVEVTVDALSTNHFDDVRWAAEFLRRLLESRGAHGMNTAGLKAHAAQLGYSWSHVRTASQYLVKYGELKLEGDRSNPDAIIWTLGDYWRGHIGQILSAMAKDLKRTGF